ncbi:MAG: segregation/condensation protein A [Syntrophomonadaceae bacterium]|nr:segregation/condensation protein A [Syntrophomonadaceae bacterium]
MGYSVELDVYQGPLDLLLKLIHENQVDIYDIPIAVITDQYLASIQEVVDVDLEVMADFLVMAATLISIKSRMLVPRPRPGVIEDEESEDPRRELVAQLLEYRQIKELAQQLEQQWEGSAPRVFYRDDPSLEPEIQLRVSVSQLCRIFQTVWGPKKDEEPSISILQGEINIYEKMQEIEDLLQNRRGGLVFQKIIENAENRREALVLFLGLLELIKLGRVRAKQSDPFGAIKIYRIWSQSDVG